MFTADRLQGTHSVGLVFADYLRDTRTSDIAASTWDITPAGVTMRAPFPALTTTASSLWAEFTARAVRELAHTDDPQSVATVNLVTPAERTQLTAWCAGVGAHSTSGTVPQRFAAMVDRHGERTAITDGDASLSYRELDARSADIATQLQSAGVGAGDRVAVAMDRSADAVAALLAVLRCGAAYLPIDTRDPVARVRFQLEDASVKALLTIRAHVSLVPTGPWRILLIDESRAPSTASNAPLHVRQDSDAVAYAMYTSGSTGVPKGVLVPHRAILGLVCDTHYVRLDAATITLHAAPLGFDAATFEIWGALLNGGTVVVHRERVPSGPTLAHAIRTRHINTAWLTAALFNAIVDADPNYMAGLAQLLIGGEALSPQHVRRARAALPDLELLNGYGPTECTTFATTFRLPRDIPESWTSIPIGRPIDGARCFVLNAAGELVPPGVVGELHIGGSGLAQGYLARPELTTERFVTRVVLGRAEPLYRTGDVVRHLSSGDLEFLGRIDSQIKLRGQRIELGEIEHALREHADVAACAVQVHRAGTVDANLVAYVVPRGTRWEAQRLREHLEAGLPRFMIPARFVRLDRLPLTTNGKLDRSALPPPDRLRPPLATEFRAPRTPDEATVCATFAHLLDLDQVGRDDNFFDLGGSSLRALELLQALASSGMTLSVAEFFAAPSPAGIVRSTQAHGESPTQRASQIAAAGAEPIAIVGMAARLPGAADVEEFWRNLLDGRDSIRHFAVDELDTSIAASLRSDPNYVRARGVVDGYADFDAAFFGVSPREAELMDPQQRVFLELCWECIESAGYAPDATPSAVGVFGGMYNSTYFQRHVQHRPELVERLGEFQTMLANEKDYLATRVAHRLNLTGPAVSLYTACSTSLVAVAQAFDSLRAGHCDMALAGGVAISCPPASGYLYQEGAMLSPDGRTRTFDREARGTVFSDGAAVVLLKRLSDAQRDGDHVYAIVRGAAINNDGAIKASFTAPSVDGQVAVIRRAQEIAGVDPATIGYVEAHGTATPLGDPIEVEALTRAFRRTTSASQFCRIGSVKSNIGHTVTAAGAAGLIKAALALERRWVPATLHYQETNPAIDLARSPFVVASRGAEWNSDASPRRAGVSSFGVGGTNAHVVLEEAPPASPTQPTAGPHLLQLSAKTVPALERMVERLANYLDTHSDANIADVAHTLRIGRSQFAQRATLVVEDSAAAAAAALRDPGAPHRISRVATTRPTRVAFLFPGQGAQYAGMGRELYAREPVFRAAFDECASAVESHAGFDLRARVFGADATELAQTATTQPALFAIEYALARLWQSRGIEPSAMIGHSVGEFVAAVIAGVMNVQDAARLVAARGALTQSQPAGAMLSVRLAAEPLAARLPPELSLAAENGPQATVVAGPFDAVERFQRAVEADGIASRRLVTSHAFHSALMDAAVEPFAAAVRGVSLSPPRIPIVSTVTGRWLEPAQAADPMYWARHLRNTVRFAPAARTLLEASDQVLIEVGPRTTLVTLAKQHTDRRTSIAAAIPSLGDAVDIEPHSWLLALGHAWAAGLSVGHESRDTGKCRRRVPLPTYPFERTRYWVDAASTATTTASGSAASENPTVVSDRAIETPAARGGEAIIDRLRQVFEQTAGIDIAADQTGITFAELGADSLMLTQVALQLQKSFAVKLTFRQLMEQHNSLQRLAAHISRTNESAPQATTPGSQSAATQSTPPAATPMPEATTPSPGTPLTTAAAYDVKRAFGAIARIHSDRVGLSDRQRARLDAFMRRYIARTERSKDYTQRHRPHLADPRVVNGFRPALKEIIYQIVIDRSKGPHVWDLDGNRYVDALNGFGMNLFGWQPEFVLDAVRRQLDAGYEIGPQHALAGEVAQSICELTGFDRAALCNTGSEAVMGAVRIARTVTGRQKIALFTGAYHGIFDEVIVRGTKSGRAVPAAPGIMPNTSENVLILEYGTPESLEILRRNAGDLAAVLIEPIQSRRPDFQPREFLTELREITRRSGALYVFDEVVTGFRAHPGGAQALLGIRADLATYGKVVGGGMPIGVIAGERRFMDALDGGHWQFGDDSTPTVGVTYFAGTFVRHPLALAAAHAVLQHLKARGPQLQASVNDLTGTLVAELNAHCAAAGAPIAVKSFASVWKTTFLEDHPLQDLLFAMMRSRGIHILDNFPCFLTTAHGHEDAKAIANAFKESIAELQEADFLPRQRPASVAAIEASRPPVPGARLGRDTDGKPAWYVPNPTEPGKYVKLGR
jgi:amino acid adenylation domain-containing protein